MGILFSENGNLQKAPNEHIDKLYAYEQSTVLFKPTKAKEDQFRGNKDKGFVLQPWTNIRFENTNIIDDGDIALSTGNYFFTTMKVKKLK